MIRDWSNFIAGRTAIVTGSGGGVGRAIAIQMARAGAHVWINDLYEDRAAGVAEEIRSEQGRASVVTADVCDPEEVARMVAETGPVDILVNNAGIPPEGFMVKSFVDTDPADWDPMIRLNLAAVLHVTHRYLPLMLERQWGRVLTIVSDAGRRGERKQVVYGAAKAAAMGFSRGLAAEVGRDGITVNCIALGTMNHGQLAAALEQHAGARGEARAELPGRPHRSGRRPRTARGPAVQRRRRVDHRPGVPRRRRVRVGALMAELPTGYLARAPDQRDAVAIAEVVKALDVADYGEPDFTHEDLLDDWMRPRFALADDAWVLIGPTGRVIGYAYVWESQPGDELEADAYVLPEYAGRGLGGQLVDLIETRRATSARVGR